MAEIEAKGMGFFGFSSRIRVCIAQPSPEHDLVRVALAEPKRRMEATFRARVGRDPSEAEMFDAYQSGKARGNCDSWSTNAKSVDVI